MAFEKNADHFLGYVMQRPLMGYISGVPLDQRTCDTWSSISNFQAHPEDILVVAYPKAGITWMQEIVDMIIMDGDAERCRRASTYDKHPFLEAVAPKPVPSGLQIAESMEPPRILKTHLPVHLLPASFWAQGCKIIYVARNPKDSMVSYFHFQRMNKGLPDPGEWEAYFKEFLLGNVPWGSWFDHVLGWWSARDRHQILYIFYEDMIENPRREIQKVMTFLGKDLPDDVLEKIRQHPDSPRRPAAMEHSKTVLIDSPPVYSELLPKIPCLGGVKKLVCVVLMVVVLVVVLVGVLLMGLHMSQKHTETIFEMSLHEGDESRLRSSGVATFHLETGINTSTSVVYDYSKMLICMRPNPGHACYITRMEGERVQSLQSIVENVLSKVTSDTTKPNDPSKLLSDPSILGTTIRVLCGDLPVFWA